MSGDDQQDGRKPPPDDQATVFVPSTPSEPDGGQVQNDEAEAAEPGEPSPNPGATVPPAAPAAAAPGQEGYASIKIGDCLNHIYEVKRFIARGGMGEVFEGVNVTSDERVAIKVMLPSLAADPNVIAMFRREAKAMTRLQHEALVQYRVLAQEPRTGVLYIVTEFIDGVPLCDVVGTLKPTPDQLKMLLRRLASGLRTAHQLGVLHRDISPDNVLLEDGKIERAKIVDFGIAKDLNPGSSTIIGEGFAGKLGYVAPEQLGDFNRELGPWTDIYSLGLVMTAAAVGHDLKMGGTLVDAVDRRRAGPDLGEAPEELRPILAAMLRPNPADRLRSMDDLLAMLDPVAPSPTTSRPPTDERALPRPAMIGLIGGALLLVLLMGGWFLLRPQRETTEALPGRPSTEAPGQAVPPDRDPLQLARTTINNTIPSVTCSWLNVMNVAGDGRELNVVMGGVAGDPSEAQSEVLSALRRAGFSNANADFSATAPIEPGGCAALDAYRQIPRAEPPRLTTSQLVWSMQLMKEGDYKGQQAAQPVVTINIGDPTSDVTLFGIEPSGVISPLLNSRQHLNQAVSAEALKKIGDDSYELKMDVNHHGWSGLVLLTGKGPFPADIVRPSLGARNSVWQERFATAASQQGWKADMLWFKVEGQRAGD